MENIKYNVLFESVANSGLGFEALQKAGFTKQFVTKQVDTSTVEKMYYNDIFSS